MATPNRGVNNWPALCGTDGGYYRHLRTTRTVPCEACVEAHRIASWERKHPGESYPGPRQHRPRPAPAGEVRWVRQGLVWRAS